MPVPPKPVVDWVVATWMASSLPERISAATFFLVEAEEAPSQALASFRKFSARRQRGANFFRIRVTGVTGVTGVTVPLGVPE